MKKLPFLLCLITASPAWAATTYYVNKSGSNSNSCATATSATDANAKLTITAGLGCVTAGAGDTVIVGDGNYDETLWSTTWKSGASAANPTTLQAENLRLAVIKPTTPATNDWIGINFNATLNYITVDGMKIDMSGVSNTQESCLQAGSNQTQSYITIKNVECANTDGDHADGMGFQEFVTNLVIQNVYIHDIVQNPVYSPITASPGNHGIYMGASGSVIEHVHIEDADGYGIQFYNSRTNSTNNIFRYSFMKNVGQNSGSTEAEGCIYANDGSGNTIHNNICISKGAYGIYVGGNSTQKVYNNVFYGQNLGGTVGVAIQGANNPSIVNNIIRNFATATSGTSSNALTNLTTDPPFIDAAGDNFNVTEAASGAIDAGTTVTVSGVSSVGSGYDIGAFEAPIRASAVVENAAPTKYLVSYSMPSQSVRSGTGLQTPTFGNWQVRDDGANQTENSAAIVSTSIVELTMNASLTAGVVDDQMTRSTAPTLTDNICIGDPNTTCYNAHIRTHGVTTGTSNVGGAGGATFNVVHFRQINWYSSVSSPTWKRIQDAASGSVAGGRLALAITIEGTGANPDATAFELYFNTGGADAAVTDSVATNAISFVNDAPSFIDQLAVSSLMSGLTCPHVTFVAGSVVGKQTSQPNIDLSQDSCTTLIVLLQTKSTASGTINIKPKLPGGTAISYGVTPSILIKTAESRF